MQKYYAWPASEEEQETDSDQMRENLEGTAPGVITGLTPGRAPANWHSLSSTTKWRFRTGGLGRGLGNRSPKMAQRLYENEMPKPIRNLGEPAVTDYINGRHTHFSHRISASNAPAKAKATGNIVLENKAANLSRGSKNMSSAGLAVAERGQRFSAIKVAPIGFKGRR